MKYREYRVETMTSPQEWPRLKAQKFRLRIVRGVQSWHGYEFTEFTRVPFRAQRTTGIPENSPGSLLARERE